MGQPLLAARDDGKHLANVVTVALFIGIGFKIGQMNTPPVLPGCAVWRIALGTPSLRQIDVMGKDYGEGQGQWLGIGLPVKLRDDARHNPK